VLVVDREGVAGPFLFLGLGELGLPADTSWSGKIYLRLHPARSPDETVTITSSPFLNHWNYEVDLPDLLSKTRYARALSGVLQAISDGEIGVRVVETTKPSPFASGLQFAFVMDWLYVDDTPRAERAASWLAVDRSMLDELMGSEGAGVDEATEHALAAVVAERRGTAPKRQARDADALAHLLERAGDLTADELGARVAPAEERRSAEDPVATLMASGRVVEFPVGGSETPRIILAEERARYQSAADGDRAARREILARYVALAGPVTVAEIQVRYGWPARWIEDGLPKRSPSHGSIASRTRGSSGVVALWSR